jgi:hypothetical protein
LAVKPLVCPKCGAGVSPNKNVCEYCNTYYVVDRGLINASDKIVVSEEIMEQYLSWYGKRMLNIMMTLEGEEFNENEFAQLLNITQLAFKLARTQLIEESGKLPILDEVCERARLYMQNPLR